MTVGYTRLSFDKYDDHLGVTRQREDITALARSLGWPEVTDFYEDNDVTANADRRKPRPDFDRLLRDMRAGVVTHVLVYDQDRLVRDMRQLEDVVDAVEAGHVMLTSVNGDIDLRSDHGRMVARIKAAVARNEIEKLSRRTKRQKLQRAQMGFKNGGTLRTYGYERDFTVVPHEAAVLIELFERKAGGESIPSLANWLNSSGVPSVTGLVGRWQQAGVATLLRRREYAGDVTINGRVVGRARFEAIVDRDLFERVDAQLPPKPAPWRGTEEAGLLTGLLVCAVCGSRMHRGRGATSRRLYKCQGGHREPPCNRQLSVSVDAPVVDAVRAKVKDLEEAGGSWWSVQVGAIEHEIEQARRMHAQGKLTQSELRSVLKHLDRRLLAERRQPGQLETLAASENWSTWTLDMKREWLATFVEQIVVGRTLRPTPGPKVELARVTIHFKDGEARNLGRPQVTMKDVARLAGCTTEHASRVLHGKGRFSLDTQERVQAAAAELGYVMSSRRRLY